MMIKKSGFPGFHRGKRPEDQKFRLMIKNRGNLMYNMFHIMALLFVIFSHCSRFYAKFVEREHAPIPFSDKEFPAAFI